MQKGKVEILVNDQGHRITPSYVAFTDEERLVGDAAKNQAAANPPNTVYDVKYVSSYPTPYGLRKNVHTILTSVKTINWSQVLRQRCPGRHEAFPIQRRQ